MGWLKTTGRPHDECIARGCGGWLGAFETEISDGETHCCRKCGREHTFHVAGDGEDASIHVTIERKRIRRGDAP